MNVRFTLAAEWDLTEAADFYEQQETGAGDYFLTCLHSDAAALSHTGGIHRVRTAGLKCAVAARFPYGIFYKLIDEEVVVHAILDFRRDPRALQRILRQRLDK